jgi:hypothetical protein
LTGPSLSQFLEQGPTTANADDQVAERPIVGIIHGGADHVVPALGIGFPKDVKRFRIHAIRIDLAFNGVDLPFPSRHDKIHLPVRLVPPVEDIAPAIADPKDIEHQVLPKHPPVVIPDAEKFLDVAGVEAVEPLGEENLVFFLFRKKPLGKPAAEKTAVNC